MSTSPTGRLRDKLVDPNDAFVVTRAVNVAYITGFEGVFDHEDAHVALVGPGRPTLFTDSRYEGAAKRSARDTPWEIVLPRADLVADVCAEARERGIERLYIEDEVPVARLRAYEKEFVGEVHVASRWIEDLRQVKSEDEIRRIKAAQELTDRAFDHILQVARVGISEAELALDLEFFMRREGSEGVAFPPIVASGPNSAYPHAQVTERVLQDGDFLKLDFGAKVDSYCADMTRTLVLGAATDRHREIYGTVLDANLAGIAAVRSGIEGRQVDAAARAVIEAAGYGENFRHGLGHGVGREVHEMPGVGPRSEALLPPGCVVTIEPGIYVPGFGGVRIEDLVLVEDECARVLTHSTKDLIEL